jgi:integrase
LLKKGRERLRELYGAELSVNMVITIHKVIDTIFNAALDRSFIEKNPATKAKLPRVHVATKKIYTNDELKKLLIEAENRGVYELFLFALCTGMERGEICALKWKDINFTKGKVVVTNSLRYIHKEYVLEPVRKDCQRRQIILSPKLLTILKEYKKNSNSIWVFPSAFEYGNRPRSPVSLTSLFHTIQKASGVIEGAFHSLRDTCAVIYLDNGMDLRSLTSLLGFENVRTVKRAFVPYMTSKKIVAADRMEGAMASIKSLYN